MKKIFIFPVIIIVLILAQSCVTSDKSHYRNFKLSMIDDYNLTMDRLKKIQFYSSGNTVTLRRELKTTESAILTGKIVSKNGKYYEEIILEYRTPGIALDYYEERKILKISYEPGYYFEYRIKPGIKPEGFFIRQVRGDDKNAIMYGTEEDRYEYDVILSGTSPLWDQLSVLTETIQEIEGESRTLEGLKIAE